MMAATVMRQEGFSLVEVMVSSLVTALAVAGLFSAVGSTQTYYESFSADVDMRQSARVALDSVATELRYAGYDTGDVEERLTIADDSTLQFVADIDDGDVGGDCNASFEDATDGGAERITYTFDAAQGTLTRSVDCYDGSTWTTGVTSSTVAQNLDASSTVFRYYDVTGTRVPLGGGSLDAGLRDDVRSVRISFDLIDTADTQFVGDANTNLQLSATVRIHNNDYHDA